MIKQKSLLKQSVFLLFFVCLKVIQNTYLFRHIKKKKFRAFKYEYWLEQVQDILIAIQFIVQLLTILVIPATISFWCHKSLPQFVHNACGHGHW